MTKKALEQVDLTVSQAMLLADAISSLQRYEPEIWKNKFVAALKEDISDIWLYEAVLQSYLFLGYPAAIEGLRTLSEVVDGKSLNDFEPWSEHAKEWLIRGSGTAGQVYRNHLGTLLSRLEKVTPELTEWMIVEGYGKVLSRPRLPLPVREFLLAVLLGVGTFVRQFEAHLHGCRNVGTPSEWLRQWFESNPFWLTTESKPVWQKFRDKYL